jgi:hypothetical protein
VLFGQAVKVDVKVEPDEAEQSTGLLIYPQTTPDWDQVFNEVVGESQLTEGLWNDEVRSIPLRFR